MESKNHLLKLKVVNLRKKGKTYSEIRKILRVKTPKSTISNWCSSINLTYLQKLRISENILNNIKKGRSMALTVKKAKRMEYLNSVEKRVEHLAKFIKDKNIAKIALAMLYLGEGSKTNRGSLMLGNSDPEFMSLFLGLLRYCYDIDEKKFRCTLQCRADQDIKKLEKFWSEITGISLKQFYGARIDARTIGKKSRKPEYKGVCRIDYFSADLFNELMKIIKVTKSGL